MPTIIDNINASLSANDKEMDKRAVAAVNAAIEKAKVCGKPIAKYDPKTKTVKLVYAEA